MCKITKINLRIPNWSSLSKPTSKECKKQKKNVKYLAESINVIVYQRRLLTVI